MFDISIFQLSSAQDSIIEENRMSEIFPRRISRRSGDGYNSISKKIFYDKFVCFHDRFCFEVKK